MTKFEAEAIVNKYGGAIALTTSHYKRLSTLPYSKAEIKYAYFVYIEAIIKDFGFMSEELGHALVICYSMIDDFIEDTEADRLNNNFLLSKDVKNFDDPAKNALIVEAMTKYRDVERYGRHLDEIQEFIDECYKKYPKK